MCMREEQDDSSVVMVASCIREIPNSNLIRITLILIEFFFFGFPVPLKVDAG